MTDLGLPIAWVLAALAAVTPAALLGWLGWQFLRGLARRWL